MGVLKQKAKGYAQAFGGAGVLADEANRARKAEKVRSVLQDAGVLPNGDLWLLDVGCSHGLMLHALAPHVGYCVGIDMDVSAASTRERSVALLRGDAERLPFSGASFDVVVCNHVYEHTDDPNQLLREIERVLKPSGVCYFAGPNKFDLVEPHYRLPLLSLLPRSMANLYVRMMKRGRGYPEKPMSWFGLRRLLSRFDVSHYTPAIVKDPARYATDDLLPPRTMKHLLARLIIQFVPFLFPTFIFVLRKKTQGISCDDKFLK